MGSGFITFRCPHCRARTSVTTQQLRALSAEARRIERARRAREREAIADEKERKKAHIAAREEEVAADNERLTETIDELNNILAATLDVDDYIDFESLKEAYATTPFAPPASLATPIEPPTREQFAPPPLQGVNRLVPGAKTRHEEDVRRGELAYRNAWEQYRSAETDRHERINASRAHYEQQVAEYNAAIEEQHAAVDELRRQFEANDPHAVVQYFSWVLDSSAYPTTFPRHNRCAFVPESRQLVVEVDLPSFDIVPEARSFKYIKARDEVAATAMAATQRREVYSSVVSQMVLRTLHEIFEADRDGRVETVVLNGFVSTTDKRTGQPVRPCLATVRTTRDEFLRLNLANVDPSECLKGLSASLSRSPAELAPVRPVLEFNMVDPRFIEESDVISTLDTRPNLMELKPTEFEALITNLFEKMGLQTRATRPSRDGGVDCVAYDERPILGGKVVIQAKRYKNTVGVSAVRDLFGTLQNEGASKGILVTTSGYGTASFEFATGKPIELLDGGNLLYLLKEHAGIDAKIVPPEDWVDPVADVGAD